MATPLNIKDPEAYQLASLIARQTGKSLTRVVVDALRHEKDRLVPRNIDRVKAGEVLARAHALPDVDDRPSAEIVADLYDNRGMWR